ncbi:MAG TPA: tetratricopeptide repeat protein, partial [Microthrixaceae bacterium]|nr:tetratricopeptide repeat protein [Microthrixaceae bacterium]HMT60354.1 tetratricopeptide repeat protein [Microthrixaceae bacterium]
RILGDDHPDTLTAKNNLAVDAWNSGEHEVAIDLTASALADAKARHGEEHPVTVHLSGLLAQMHEARR